jgi:tetratricopeptide (TPR) repeat protein
MSREALLLSLGSAGAGLLMLAGCAGSLLLSGCAGNTSEFDSAEYLRRQIEPALGAAATEVPVPFELAPELMAVAGQKLRAGGDDRVRAGKVVDYIFHGLDLQYAIEPTRDANETFKSRAGNCLSFVNLFVALARYVHLSPFYVEVEDYQRWNHRQGMVISQGHIVAGLYIGGDLKTYDFMPYRVKSYRDFKPIDDLTATAHYYNNLGAEALLAGRDEDAGRFLEIAGRIDPKFVKGTNNLGVLHARRGDYAKAIELYRGALAIDPQNVPVLTNLARAYQQTGRGGEADEILASIEGVHHSNPFFYVYRADLELSRGDGRKALDLLRQALALDSETPEVHLGLARVYVANGEIEKAKHHLERAIKLDPSHPEARQLAAMLLPALAPQAGGTPEQ